MTLRALNQRTPRVFEHGLEPVGELGHVGYIDRKGVLRIPPTFFIADRFLPSGHAIVQVDDGTSAPSKHALIDTTGRYLIEPRDEWVSDFAPNGLALLMAQGLGSCGYIDRSGTIRIPEKFERAGPFASNGLAAAMLEGGKMGYIDASGTFAIPAAYDNALDFGTWAPHGLARVTVADRQMFIDRRGRVIATLDPGIRTYGEFRHGLAQAREGLLGDWGFVDEHGRTVVPARFEAENDFSENGTAAVKLDQNWGFIDTMGRFVIQPIFGGARSFGRNGLAPVAIGKKWGYINGAGTMVIPPRYDNALSFNDNGLALVEIERP